MGVHRAGRGGCLTTGVLLCVEGPVHLIQEETSQTSLSSCNLKTLNLKIYFLPHLHQRVGCLYSSCSYGYLHGNHGGAGETN